MLKAGNQSHGAWGEKVAKVEIFCLIKVVTFLNPINELITRQKSLVFKALNLCTMTVLLSFDYLQVYKKFNRQLLIVSMFMCYVYPCCLKA